VRVALAAVVAVVLLAVGGVVAWSLRSPATVALITAAVGGTITTDDGVSVRFGPGALTEDTEVRIAPRPSIEAPDGLTWLTEPVDIALGAGTLRTSATVTLPLTATTAGLATLVARDADGVWSRAGGVVDGAARTITATVGQLSITSAARADVTAPDLAPGTGARDSADPNCGTIRSERWTARVEGAGVRTCVAAGAADRPALLRVVSDRASGQFAELGAYPRMWVAAPAGTSLADTIWQRLAAADRDHTFLPGQGTLDLALPGSFDTIDFVTRGGLDVTVAEYVVEVMSSAYVPAGVTVEAVRCALAQRPTQIGDQVLGCVTQALAGERILPEDAAVAAEKLAKQEREAVDRAVRTAIRDLPAVLDPLVRDQALDNDSRRVIAERSPVIPHKALNEPGGAIPAAVVATQERLYGAATRDDLTGALPPAGLVWSNTSLAGDRVTTAVAALVTTPPLRWPCDETARDGYVFGMADANLLTYPARLSDLGLPPEDVGIVRQTAGLGRNYRLCIALDGTWTSLTHDLPTGEFPSAEAAKLARLGTAPCRNTEPNAFLPPDSVCRSAVRTDLDGDGRTDTMLLYRRAGGWTARAVLAAGRVSDLPLPGVDQPEVIEDLDLDGEPGEEVVLRTGSVLRLVSSTSDGLVLIGQDFPTGTSLEYTAGLGCADVNGDGRPELVEGSAAFDRDPATGAITAARTTETWWTWKGKTLWRGATASRRPSGTVATAPPYRGVTCSWR